MGKGKGAHAAPVHALCARMHVVSWLGWQMGPRGPRRALKAEHLSGGSRGLPSGGGLAYSEGPCRLWAERGGQQGAKPWAAKGLNTARRDATGRPRGAPSKELR